MDLFEKYLASQEEIGDFGRKGVSVRGYITRQLEEKPGESRQDGLSRFRPVGGRRGFGPGDKCHFVEVVGPHVQAGASGVAYTNREYIVKCSAPGPGGKPCGRTGIATYHQLYYQSLYSCGCTVRPKHPPIRLEGQRIGLVEVLRWTADYGGMWELVCHECGEVLYRKTVYQVRAAGASCSSHKTAVA